jgi:hypothetical protein
MRVQNYTLHSRYEQQSSQAYRHHVCMGPLEASGLALRTYKIFAEPSPSRFSFFIKKATEPATTISYTLAFGCQSPTGGVAPETKPPVGSWRLVGLLN